MQVTVPPNVPGGAAGKRLIGRMRGAYALAGLDGVDRLYRLNRPRRMNLRGLGADCVDPSSGESVTCPGDPGGFNDPGSYMPSPCVANPLLAGCPGASSGSGTPIIAASTPNTTPATSSWDKLWQSVIGGWSSTGQQVVKQSNLPTGVYMQTGPNGTVYYSQPAGNSSNIFGAGSASLTAGVGSGSMTPIMLGGLGLVAVFVLMQMGKR